MHPAQMAACFDELTKLAQEEAEHEEPKPNLNFFERHPKKILGGLAATAVAGGVLYHNKDKIKSMLSKSPPSSVKGLLGPASHLPVKVPGPSKKEDYKSVLDYLGMGKANKHQAATPRLPAHVSKPKAVSEYVPTPLKHLPEKADSADKLLHATLHGKAQRPTMNRAPNTPEEHLADALVSTFRKKETPKMQILRKSSPKTITVPFKKD